MSYNFCGLCCHSKTRRTREYACNNALAIYSPSHPINSGNRYGKLLLRIPPKVFSNLTTLSDVGLAADSIVYKDPDTGFTFSQYNANYKYQSPNVITFRTAVPTSATAPYDVVLQLTALKEVAWLGLSWGGTMLNNPLTVVWPNGNTVTISSRLATYIKPIQLV